MSGRTVIQRREICAFTGMAVGFRAFYAVFVDGRGLMNSGWLAVLAGLILALPAVCLLIPIRKGNPSLPPAEEMEHAAGKWSVRALGIILFALLTYDAAASVRILAGTVRYVAMPEGNSTVIMAVTAFVIVLAALRGPAASAGAAILWRKTAGIVAAILVLLQITQLRVSRLTPVLGPGMDEILIGAFPAAGILSFVPAGWLMLNPEQDAKGTAMLKTLLITGVCTAVMTAVFSMLTPVMPDEPTARSFRLGRLLANDRAGLSPEMLYVILLYGGMLTMLLFEMTAAVFSLGLACPGVKIGVRVPIAGAIMLGLAVSGAAEREIIERAAVWYYPAAALPFVLIGAGAMIRNFGRRKESRGE